MTTLSSRGAKSAVLVFSSVLPRSRRQRRLAGRDGCRHAFGMFVVTEADATAIRATFEQEGELSAAIELRRRFPGITDNMLARAYARSIAGWKPLSATPRRIVPLHPPGTAD